MDHNEFELEMQRIRALTQRAVEDIPAPRKDTRDKSPATLSVRAGALLRRSLRHELMDSEHYGVTFTEDKGWLDSYFVIRGPRWALDVISEALADFNRRSENG